MKHTNGPWESFQNEKGRYVSTGKRSHDSVICHLDNISKEDEVVKSNAKLIAAAPEMREAMQWFCDRVEKGEVRSTRTYNKFKEILKKNEA